MSSTFHAQRRIGDELLAHGWHTTSIAAATIPGSAWILHDPTRRIRVRMTSDLTAALAEVSAIRPPGSASAGPLWKLTIHHAPARAILTVLAAAPDAVDSACRAGDRRAILGALKTSGLRPDRSRLARALAGTAVWHDYARQAEVVWTVPYKTAPGGWTLNTRSVLAEATLRIPSAVLAPLILATGLGRSDAS